MLDSTGLDAAEKRFGQGKVDPAKMRSTNEKITDGIRGQFEKLTGYVLPRLSLVTRKKIALLTDFSRRNVDRKHVPEKFSN
jgi:hypothetical protein